MEATGYYHYQLAYYLLETGIKVSVENPLSVKRFIQAHLTDKDYSQKIEEFISENENKGFRVIVDALQNGRVERNAYMTKAQ